MINIFKTLSIGSARHGALRNCIAKFGSEKYKIGRVLDSPYPILYLNKRYSQGKRFRTFPLIIYLAPAIAMLAYNFSSYSTGWNTTNSLIFTGLLLGGSFLRLFNGFRLGRKIMCLQVDRKFEYIYVTTRFSANVLSLSKGNFFVSKKQEPQFYENNLKFDVNLQKLYAGNLKQKGLSERYNFAQQLTEYCNIKVPIKDAKFMEVVKQMQKKDSGKKIASKLTANQLKIFMAVRPSPPTDPKDFQEPDVLFEMPLNENIAKENEDILIALVDGQQIDLSVEDKNSESKSGQKQKKEEKGDEKGAEKKEAGK